MRNDRENTRGNVRGNAKGTYGVTDGESHGQTHMIPLERVGQHMAERGTTHVRRGTEEQTHGHPSLTRGDTHLRGTNGGTHGKRKGMRGECAGNQRGKYEGPEGNAPFKNGAREINERTQL